MSDDVERGGATTPTEFPHRCPFSAIGVSRISCTAFTTDRNSNRHCVETNCNSELRACSVCVREVVHAMMGHVIDPAEGLCITHRKRAEVEKILADTARAQSQTDTPLLAMAKTKKKVRRAVAGVALTDDVLIERALSLVHTLSDMRMRIFLELPNLEFEEIGKRFRIKENTLNVHVSHIYKHLQLNMLRQQDKRPTLLKIAALYAARKANSSEQ